MLMVVCSLGKDVGWSDPTVYTKIPMDAIIELWREQSSHRRYSNNNEFFSSLESLLEASGDT